MRQATLQSLNALGREFRVSFRDELLIMSPTGDEGAIAQGKAAGTLFDLVSVVTRLGFEAERLWFGGRVDVLCAAGFALLADRFPRSLREAQADFLAPLALAEPVVGLQMIAMLRSWGIDRVSLSWNVGRKAELLEYLLDAGMGIDLRDLCDAEALLSAVLLGPDSITADLQRPPVFLPAG